MGWRRPARGQKDCVRVRCEFEGADGKGRNHTSKSPLCVTVQCQNCQSSSSEPMGVLGESLGLAGGVKSMARQCVSRQMKKQNKIRGGYYARTGCLRQWSFFSVFVGKREGRLRTRNCTKTTRYSDCCVLPICTSEMGQISLQRLRSESVPCATP